MGGGAISTAASCDCGDDERRLDFLGIRDAVVAGFCDVDPLLEDFDSLDVDRELGTA
jgi:hypothetical protein